MICLRRLAFSRYSFSTAKRSKVFLDISVNSQPLGRLQFELFDDIVPKTSENFRRLCIGDFISPLSNLPLHFKGKRFFRIIPGFMSQSGDVTKDDGTGGESIYGPVFADENFKVPLNQAGILGMINKGSNTNSSNFFITHLDCSFLEGKYVGFGKLIDGLPILNQIEYCGDSSKNGKPKKEVVITDCGVILPKK